jgi:hypothetical protein
MGSVQPTAVFANTIRNIEFSERRWADKNDERMMDKEENTKKTSLASQTLGIQVWVLTDITIMRSLDNLVWYEPSIPTVLHRADGSL